MEYDAAALQTTRRVLTQDIYFAEYRRSRTNLLDVVEEFPYKPGPAISLSEYRRRGHLQRGMGGAARWNTGLMARPDWMRETPGMRVSTSSMKRW